MFTESELQNRMAVITGASRGIGKAVALELASAGAAVALGTDSLSALFDPDSNVRAIQ
jgi:NAD(P)-dependent dehydrogenase (short-subunit alcohol dehydrogenase family)